MRDHRGLSVIPGPGGACLIRGDGVTGRLFVFVSDFDGRLAITDVVWQPGSPIDSAAWRHQPISRIEALINSSPNADAIRARMGEPAPELRLEMPEQWVDQRLRQHRIASLKLEVPEGGKYPDDFYRRVARLYESLAVGGQAPAPSLAEANGVPVTTVHRWIREARRRKFLAPGQRGRAG